MLALRRAHLLPPSRAPSLPCSWLVGWLLTAYGSKFAFSILAHLGGRAGREIVRSVAPPQEGGDAKGDATYLLRVEQWAKERKTDALARGRKEGALTTDANAIGASKNRTNERTSPSIGEK